MGTKPALYRTSASLFNVPRGTFSPIKRAQRGRGDGKSVQRENQRGRGDVLVLESQRTVLVQVGEAFISLPFPYGCLFESHVVSKKL